MKAEAEKLMTTPHYYLVGEERFDNMKEVCEYLKIPGTLFKAFTLTGLITKVSK